MWKPNEDEILEAIKAYAFIPPKLTREGYFEMYPADKAALWALERALPKEAKWFRNTYSVICPVCKEISETTTHCNKCLQILKEPTKRCKGDCSKCYKCADEVIANRQKKPIP